MNFLVDIPLFIMLTLPFVSLYSTFFSFSVFVENIPKPFFFMYIIADLVCFLANLVSAHFVDAFFLLCYTIRRFYEYIIIWKVVEFCRLLYVMMKKYTMKR